MLITNIFKPQPIVKTTIWKLALYSLTAVGLGVFLPWFCHQFGIAGQVFLPMHFFVLTSALILGWRAGLFVGILTPIVSYFSSGMPFLPVLPQITLEIAAYGFFAGLFREKYNFGLWSALISAMFLGRLVLLLAVWFLKPLNPFLSTYQAIWTGLPGILIQLALIPFIAIWISRFFKKFSQEP